MPEKFAFQKDCPGCQESFVTPGYRTGGYMDEEFCSEECATRDAERAQERLVERT